MAKRFGFDGRAATECRPYIYDRRTLGLQVYVGAALRGARLFFGVFEMRDEVSYVLGLWTELQNSVTLAHHFLQSRPVKNLNLTAPAFNRAHVL